MNSILLAREERHTMPLDAFYFAVTGVIDKANPRSRITCADLRTPLGLGLRIYPLRVYETIRKLKEQNDGNRASS